MINVIGLGYIGLPTALVLATKGFKVIGTDYNEFIIDKLNRKELTFEEKGLQELFDLALSKDIKFQKSYAESDYYIIAVPTPYNYDTKKIDPSFVINALNEILKYSPFEATVIIESTVSPGTIDKFLLPVAMNSKKKINLVHAPERIIPGNMIYELANNSRTIGAYDISIAEKVGKIYSKITTGKIVLTSTKIAEMTKVVENTYRAVNIGFANELAKICKDEELNVYDIINICNMHPRVNILSPGPGVGGHCIPVDPWFLVGDYPDKTGLIRNALETNESMPLYVSNRVEEIIALNENLKTSRIGLYGLTYKENVDDCRESPTFQLLKKLQKNTLSKVIAYDPHVKNILTENQYFDFFDFLNAIDFIVIMVKHDHIKENIELIKNKTILDTQNICFFDGVYKL